MLSKKLCRFDEVKEAEIKARVAVAAEVKPYTMLLCNNLKLIYVSREMLGLDPSECVGMGFDEIYVGPINIYVRSVLKKAKENPDRCVEFEMKIPTSRGVAEFDEQCVYLSGNNQFLITGQFARFAKSDQ